MVLALFWAAATDTMNVPLGVGIFFELLWLDLIPIGTYLPPHSIFSTFAALVATTYFGLTDPTKILIVMILCVPLAFFGARVEAYARQLQNRNYNKIIGWARKEKATSEFPQNLILKTILFQTFFAFVTFAATIPALLWVLSIIFQWFGHEIVSIRFSWPILWFFASIGGLLALRLRRAYYFVSILVAIGCLIVLLVRY
ncbi:MAG: hypothetical protein ACNI27_07515 [Desulfovibrio sp.]